MAQSEVDVRQFILIYAQEIFGWVALGLRKGMRHSEFSCSGLMGCKGLLHLVRLMG